VGRLDRLPLAIELAAARSQVLSVKQLIERLNQRFALLRRGAAGARHAELETTVALAVELLSPAQRELLGELSVFRGSFDFEAAEAVVQPKDDVSVLDTLAELVSRSLVTRVSGRSGDVRFRLYESVRAFVEGPPRPETIARHAAYYTRESAGTEAQADLAFDAANLYAIFDRHETSDPSIAAKALLVLKPSVEAHGPLLDYIERAARIERVLGSADPGLAARLALAIGRIRVMRGDIVAARELLSRAQEFAQLAQTPMVAAEARTILALSLHWQGLADDAAKVVSEADAEGSLADSDFARGALHLLGGRVPEAVVCLERCVLARRAQVQNDEDRSELGLACAVLGNALVEQQRYGEARLSFDEARQALGRADNRRYGSFLRMWEGFLALDEGRIDDAERALEEAREGLLATQDRFFLRSALGYRGILTHLRGDAQGALAWFAQALDGGMEQRHLYPIGHFLAHQGAALAALGRSADAEESFLRAQGLAQRAMRPQLVATTECLRIMLDVARAEQSADPAEARDHLGNAQLRRDRALAARSTGTAPVLDLRLALRLVEPRLAAGKAGMAGQDTRATLHTGPQMNWFRVADGATVDLSRRALLRRLLSRLVDHLESGSDTSVDSFGMFEAGWPGETATGESGLHRVHVAVATLRKMGLGPVLVTDPSGYRLSARLSRQT
jgi:tetratricopeptide (TPR) repeat protein